MSDAFLSNDYLNIVAQIWIAFGRGVGEKQVSAAAVDVLVGYYRPLSRQIIGEWQTNHDLIMARAWSIGHESAVLADGEDSDVISASHVDESINAGGICRHYSPEDGFS